MSEGRPYPLEPRGLNREQAAHYVGVGTTRRPLERPMTREEAEAFATKFVASLPHSDPLRSMSVSAWAVLAQLARGPVWDGDLVSKEGRTELIRLGIAQRIRRDERGLAINELTEDGKWLAVNLDTGPGGHA